MICIATLGSGSAGNALIVRSNATTLLVDCGFTMKETLARLQTINVSPSEIDAILITHEHGDHMRGVGPLSRKFGLPVWLTPGTYRAAKDSRFARVHLFHAHWPFVVGDLTVDPFPTPHDAAESCQFVFAANGVRFANVTDLGACTPHVLEKLLNIDGLLIECNYDHDMLKNGPYPAALQARIRSNYGHLGNEQAGRLLNQLDHPALQCILLGHLSEQNNTSAAALETVGCHLDFGLERLFVLDQHTASHWFTIQSTDVSGPKNLN